MKQLKLWIVMMVTGYMGFSQSLTPLVQQVNEDTLFCFTLPQSRGLAKLILAGTYNDSIIQSLELENRRLYHLLQTKDQLVSNLERKGMVVRQVAGNYQQSLYASERQLESAKKQQGKLKKQKRSLIAGIVGITLITVFK